MKMNPEITLTEIKYPSYPVRHSLEGAGHPPHRLHEDAVLALLKLRPGYLCEILTKIMVTLQTAYKVAICPRGNLPYKQIYFISELKLQ